MSIMGPILMDAYRKAGYLEDARDDAADAEEIEAQKAFLKEWATPENIQYMMTQIDSISEVEFYIMEEYLVKEYMNEYQGQSAYY
jgi:hypothetical protein